MILQVYSNILSTGLSQNAVNVILILEVSFSWHNLEPILIIRPIKCNKPAISNQDASKTIWLPVQIPIFSTVPNFRRFLCNNLVRFNIADSHELGFQVRLGWKIAFQLTYCNNEPEEGYDYSYKDTSIL